LCAFRHMVLTDAEQRGSELRTPEARATGHEGK